MKKIVDENGDFTEEYLQQIKSICEKYDKEFLEDRLCEATDYFEERKKHGWPFVKTENDLRVECYLIPLIHRCIEYLDK